ncbi:MAG: hypothetical protein FWG70_09305, partial [Oscillospiraceae bacterium]|nr:hypothetical protein [Oscillospiraceae bacterium]
MKKATRLTAIAITAIMLFTSGGFNVFSSLSDYEISEELITEEEESTTEEEVTPEEEEVTTEEESEEEETTTEEEPEEELTDEEEEDEEEDEALRTHPGIIDFHIQDYDQIIDNDVVITSAMTISNKTVLYTGNVTIAATVTVSANATVVVLGTVNINSGLLILSGNMYCLSDFRIQTKYSDGTYGATAGRASISGGAKLTVYGDFYTQTTQKNNFGSGSSANRSILELHGDFNQIGTNTFFSHSYNTTNKTIFAGSGIQNVSFDRYDSNASLGVIEVTNEQGLVNFITPTYLLYPVNDIRIGGEVEIYSTGGANKTIDIEGNLTIKGSCTFNNDVNVTGDVIVEGVLTLEDDRKMTVGGDFRIQSKDINGTYGATSGRASLSGGAKLTVYGDFYTQTTQNNNFGSGSSANRSILELHGNFSQIGTNTFFKHYYNTTHRTVFAGSGTQNVSFDRYDSNASLGIIEGININLLSPVHTMNIGSNMTLSGLVNVSNLNLNGNDVTISALAPVIAGGLGNGTLTCNGNLTINATLSVDKGTLICNGNLNIDSGKLNVDEGKADIHGNLT